MKMNTEKTLFIGIDNDGDLISLELNFDDLNKGTKFYDPHYRISPHGYTDIKDDDAGEKEARESLEDPDYWDDIYGGDKNDPRLEYVNYRELADRIINTDGWQMTNGEYYEIGLFEDKWYFVNLSWIGRDHKELFDKRNYKKLYINEEDFKFLKNNPEIKEGDEKKVYEVKAIFSKIQDTKQIISDMLKEHGAV